MASQSKVIFQHERGSSKKLVYPLTLSVLESQIFLYLFYRNKINVYKFS